MLELGQLSLNQLRVLQRCLLSCFAATCELAGLVYRLTLALQHCIQTLSWPVHAGGWPEGILEAGRGHPAGPARLPGFVPAIFGVRSKGSMGLGEEAGAQYREKYTFTSEEAFSQFLRAQSYTPHCINATL